MLMLCLHHALQVAIPKEDPNMRIRLLPIVVAALALSPTLPLAAESVPLTQPGPDAAQISGRPGYLVQDMYPVRIIRINGQNIQPRDFVWLEPGRYELRVEPVRGADPLFSRNPERGRERRGTVATRSEAFSIELEVEAGKTYEVRARYNRHGSDGIPWSTVLWRIDE